MKLFKRLMRMKMFDKIKEFIDKIDYELANGIDEAFRKVSNKNKEWNSGKEFEFYLPKREK